MSSPAASSSDPPHTTHLKRKAEEMTDSEETTQQQQQQQQTNIDAKEDHDDENDDHDGNDGNEEDEEDDGDEQSSSKSNQSKKQTQTQTHNKKTKPSSSSSSSSRFDPFSLVSREEKLARISDLSTRANHLYPNHPEMRLLIYNVSKKQNIGTITRTAVAFACSQVIVVGGDRKFQTFGNQNTLNYMAFRHFSTLNEFLDSDIIQKEGFKLVGVEIGENALDVNTHPFFEKSIIVMGNEGQGIAPALLAKCDRLVYIPQYGHGTASLNVASAAAIVMQHFATWAKYPQASVTGQKFVVDEGKRVKPAGLLLKEQLMAEYEAKLKSEGTISTSAVTTETNTTTNASS